MNPQILRGVLARRFNLPKEDFMRKTMRSFTIAEKAVFYFFASVFIISGFYLLWQVNDEFLVEVPLRGGTLTEGIIGNPRFINPVLAISEADKNLSSLVYSGLVRPTQDGGIENDLAAEISISEDHLTYTARIRHDARFHDGTPVTADDIVFTVQKIQDPLIRSPKRGDWDGISVEKLAEDTVVFTLRQAYAPFIHNLGLGILPRHIWRNVPEDEFSFSQFNTLPIGSGPYKVEKVTRNSGGIPDYYKLVPADTGDAAPFLKNLVFRFYPNEAMLIQAFNDHKIESLSGISPEKVLELRDNKAKVVSSPIPRVFAVFFNGSKTGALSHKEVRQALDLASPKEEIIEEILGGHGTAIEGPVPAGLYDWASERNEARPFMERFEEAVNILSEAGWTADPEIGVLEKRSGTDTITLSFSISTSDAPELKAVGDKLVYSWRQLGAAVDLMVFEAGDLNQNVIRPRNFDSLLFGEVIGRESDIYPFWHSSQKGDPGLNVAMYDSEKADTLLEDARSAPDRQTAEEHYKAFAEEVKADIPAVFLYTPNFIYVVPEKLSAIGLGGLGASHDRFLGIKDWYVETDKVWRIFAKDAEETWN